MSVNKRRPLQPIFDEKKQFGAVAPGNTEPPIGGDWPTDIPPPPPPPPPPPDDPGVFEYNVTEPIAANTGLTTPTTSTWTTGSMSNGAKLYTLQNGEVHTNVRFEVNLQVAAGAHAELIDCETVGDPVNGAGTVQRGVVVCTSVGASIRAYRCKSEPALPHIGYSTNWFGHDMDIDRCDNSGCEDAFGFSGASGATSSDNNIVGNYNHDFVKWTPAFGGRPEGSHNDGAQHHNAAGHRGNNVQGNSFEMTIDPTKGTGGGNRIVSGVMFSPQGTGTQIVGTVSFNWFSYCEVGMNMAGWTGSGHVLHADGNRFRTATMDDPDGGIIKQASFHFTGQSSMIGNVNIDGLGVETPFTEGAWAGSWP